MKITSLILISLSISIASEANCVTTDFTSHSFSEGQLYSSRKKPAQRHPFKVLEKFIGRKLTLNEKLKIRVASIITRKKMKSVHFNDGDPVKRANIAFIFAILALALCATAFLPWSGGSILGLISILTLALLSGTALLLGIKARKNERSFKSSFAIIVGGGILLFFVIVLISALSF